MSRLTLVTGNKNYSSWSLRPWIFLKYHQLDFEDRRVLLFTDETDAALVEYDSDFKVPVLIDGDLVVWDSLAILEHVSETFLENGGWPKDREARALARSISAEMHSSFANLRNELPMNCRKTFKDIPVSRAARREIERVKSLWRKCREHYGAGGKWLFGDYSIADAMYAPIVLRFTGYGIPLSGIEADYAENVLSDPGMMEWTSAAKRETEIIEADEIG